MYDRFLFFRRALRREQGDSDQRVIGEPLRAVFPVKKAIFLHESEKKSGGDAFVPVDEAVIFDDEIEEIRSFVFQTRV
jgi:hypothetical protein